MKDVQDLYRESYEETLLREIRQNETDGESYHVHLSENSVLFRYHLSPDVTLRILGLFAKN